jgi:hypothetical protein
VAVGCHLHTHNIKSNLSGALEYTYTPDYKEPAPAEGPTFLGYPRADGSVGVRNEIWIIPTVGCVNSVARAIETELRERTGYSEIYAYTHPYGCSQLGDDQLFTQKCLSGLIRHPNAAGVLVLGLGCENNNIPELQKVLGETDPNREKFLVAQEVEDEITAGAELLLPLVEEAKTYLAALYLFEKNDLKLPNETLDAIDAELAELMDYRADGSKSQFNALLAEYGVNYKLLREAMIISEKISYLKQYLFGADGSKIAENLVDDYYRENYRRFKVIPD